MKESKSLSLFVSQNWAMKLFMFLCLGFSQLAHSQGVFELQNDEPIYGLASSPGQELAFVIDVPTSAAWLNITIDGGSGNADLIVRFDDYPSLNKFDCRPYLAGNNESCTFEDIQPGPYFIIITSNSGFDDVRLNAQYSNGPIHHADFSLATMEIFVDHLSDWFWGDCCEGIFKDIFFDHEDPSHGNVMYAEFYSDFTLPLVHSIFPQDLRHFSGGTIEFDLKVLNEPGNAQWEMKMGYGYQSGWGSMTLTDSIEGHSPVVGQWQHYTFRLNDLVMRGLDLRDVDTVLSVFPAWGNQAGAAFLLDNIVLTEAPPGLADMDGDGTSDYIDECPHSPFGQAVNAVGCFNSHTMADPIDVGKSLLITDLSVVNSPEAQGYGPLSFAGLITQLMPQHNPSEFEKTEFVLEWLRHWEEPQFINGFMVEPREEIIDQVIEPWFAASGHTGVLDLSIAPFRLLAVVNRMDLYERDESGQLLNAGEARFVFGVVDETGHPLPFTVIFEYALPVHHEFDLMYWADEWYRLSQIPFGQEYNYNLVDLTERFTSRWKLPEGVNGSALKQIRTNEVALAFPWEMREFKLSHFNGRLSQVPLKNTPDGSLNGTPMLGDLINVFDMEILTGEFMMPNEFMGNPILAGSALISSPRDVLSVPDTENPDAKRIVSLNSCVGCHAVDTGTEFQHIRNREEDASAQLSAYLTGQALLDIETGELRHFSELNVRKMVMERLLSPGSEPHPNHPLNEQLTETMRRVTH